MGQIRALTFLAVILMIMYEGRVFGGNGLESSELLGKNQRML